MAVEVERLIVTLEARLDRYDANLRAANVATDRRVAQIEQRFDRMAGRLRTSASTAAMSVGAALGGLATALSGRELARYADGWTTVTRALESGEQIFGVRMRSASALNKLASESRADLDSFSKLYMRTAAATRELGVSEEDVARSTQTVAMALKLGSASASEQASVMLQLSQALQKGKLDGDEFRSVMENAGIVQELLAKRLNVSKGSLIKMAADGKIGVRDLFAALTEGHAEVTRIFRGTPATIGEAFVVLNNAVTEYVGNLDTATGASRSLVDVLASIARNAETVGDVALTAGAALLAAFGPRLVAGIGAAGVGVASMVGPLGLLAGAVAAASVGFTFLADNFVVAADGVTTVRDQISAVVHVLGNQLQPAMTVAGQVVTDATTVITAALAGVPVSLADVGNAVRALVNAMIGVFAFGVEALERVVSSLPAVIAEQFIAMANRVIRVVADMNNVLIDLLNKLPGVELPRVSTVQFKNSFDGARAELGGSMREAARHLSRDFVGEFSAGLAGVKTEIDAVAQSIALGRRLAASTTTQRPIPTIAKRPDAPETRKKSKRSPFEREVRQAEEGIRLAQLEARSLGVSAEKTLAAKTALELLNAAKQEGIKITPQILAQIDELSTKFAAAKTEAERLREAFDDIKSTSSDVLRGFITDLKNGKSGAEALHGALDKISNKLIDMAVNQLIQNAFGPVLGSAMGAAGGGGLSQALTVFKFAQGGVAAHGRPLPLFSRGGVSNTAAIFGEAGPEAAVPLPDGRRIPVDLRVPEARPAPGGVGGEVRVTVDTSERLVAEIETRAEGVVARRAPQIVSAAIRETDRALPGMIRKSQARSL